MSGGEQFFDIIIFAVIAAFLILRLRSVLGRRDGHQGPSRGPLGSPKSKREKSDDETVVRLPDRSDSPADAAPTLEAAEEPRTPLDAGITAIRVADPNFDPNELVSGAKIAFELILTAFASADTDTLKALLSPDVFANFNQSIQEREKAGETLETTLVGIKTAEIVEAYMAGRTAHVTIKFLSQQISVTCDANNNVVEGDPSAITEVTDFWTFARDTRSSDPNWSLVATGSLD